MANRTREELKDIFVTGAKPTQANFRDWLDNYLHHSDAIPAANITENTTQRFVSDAQIAGWNAKQDITAPATDYDTTGYYVVKRKYAGAGQAYVTGPDLPPASGNPGYTTQLSAASRGSIDHTYPDPYAARAAAISDINSGAVAKAVIIIAHGQRWTIGSNENAKNGDSSGNAAIATAADIQFDINGNTGVANLLHPAITYVFGEEAGFTYINKVYNIYLGYINNPSSATKSTVNLLGQGKFIQVYGEAQGFSASLLYVNDPNLYINHSYRELVLNMWNAFRFDNISCNIMRVGKCVSYENNVIDIRSSVQGQDPHQVHDIAFDTITWGNIPTAPMAAPKADNWYCFYITYNAMPSKINIRVRNMYQKSTGGSCLARLINYVATVQHVGITVDNYHQDGSANTVTKQVIALNFRAASDTSYFFHLKQAYVESTLIRSYGSTSGSSANSFMKLQCDHARVNINSQNTEKYVFYNIVQDNSPHTNCWHEIQGTYHLVNGGMYTENINGTSNGMLTIFKNALITVPATNTANVFEKASSTDNCLLLDGVTIRCANGKSFVNTSGATPKIFIQSVATTDATPDATITYEGETIKTIPAGYFK